MSLNNTLPKQLLKKVMAVILSFHLAMPASVFAQQSLSRPTDRWKASPSGSYLGGMNIPIEINNLLPELATDGFASGNASINTSGDGLHLSVDQESARLLAYWNSFDIGANNSVTFNQPGADAVALNIIQQQSPSKIFGALNCTAACWLVNPNGVFFGEHSQVNARGFLAAAMEFTGVPMDLNLLTPEERNDFAINNPFERENLFDGIDSNKTFLHGGRDTVAGSDELPRIIVQAGAKITSDNAPVVLAGPEVINEGKISSENGQIVMAGSRRDVYLALANVDNSTAVNTNTGKDQKYRGFLIEVDSGAGSERGAAINAGELTANFGNVTLVASELVQAGKIKSTTAVDVNGSVRLIARDQAGRRFSSKASLKTSDTHIKDALYFDADLEAPLASEISKVTVGTEGGDLVLTSGSSIEIAIDQSNRTATDADDFAQPKSQINLEGRYVVMEEDAAIVAPSADVSVRARMKPDIVLNDYASTSDAFFHMESGSVIDVSGTDDTQLSAARNTVEFFVTSNELKDSPEQKDGVLLREKIQVDRLRGTPLFAWEVALESIAKTANERAATGGSVNVLSNNAVIIDDGAVIDVSGGRINYAAGSVESTRVLGKNGWVDISEASPLDPYFAVSSGEYSTLNHPKWGEVTSFRPTPVSNRQYRSAYFEGMSAGSIAINSPQQAISDTAQLNLQTTLGRYQLQSSSGSAANGLGGHLTLDTRSQGYSSIAVVGLGEVDFVNQILDRELRLTRDLLEKSGAAKITLEAGAYYRQDEHLLFKDGTDLSVTADSIYADHNIRTVGGDVALRQEGSDGELVVSGIVDTSGSWTNDLQAVANTPRTSTAAISGGDITLAAVNSLQIREGAKFNSSAGAWLNSKGKLKFGSAGDVTFSTSTSSSQADLLIETPLNVTALDSGRGGLLTFEVNTVTFGEFGESTFTENMLIDNSFFSSGSVAVGGYAFSAEDGNVLVQSDAVIDLQHQSFVTTDAIENKNSSIDTSSILLAEYLPDYLNSSGQLILTAKRKSDANDEAGVLSLAFGSRITGPANSSVELQANNRLLIDGNINVAGGDLSAVLTQIDGGSENTNLKNYILVGNNAAINLSANAYRVPTVDGSSLYRMIEAGTFSLDAQYGFALVAPDADIALRGKTVNSVERVYSATNTTGKLEPRRTDLAAGKVFIKGEHGVQVGTVFDFGASDLASNNSINNGRAGGELSLSLNANDRVALNDSSSFPVLDFQLDGSYTGAQLSNIIFGENINNNLIGKGAVNTENFTNNNLSRLVINVDNSSKTTTPSINQISLLDDVVISAIDSIVLDAPTLNLNNHSLELRAAYMQIGETGANDIAQTSRSVVDGDGELFAAAEMIDLYGNLTVNGAEQVSLFASNGLRYRSTFTSDGTFSERSSSEFKTSANILIGTPRMWGATLADYHFNLVGTDSVFELGAIGNNTAPVISFGSELTVNADNIFIDSAIHNPFGTITLDAAETLTLGGNAHLSVAGSGVTPFGRQLGDQAVWFYSFSDGAGGRIQYDENLPFPEKLVDLKGAVITADPDSVVDISGGGSVFSREFVAGLGGTVDILSGANYENYFAILPTQTGGYAPFDEMEYRGTNIPLGSEIAISGSRQVADGTYTILPASYGLLPGAYLVSPTELSFSVGQGFRAVDSRGAEVIAGHIQSAGGTSSSWSGFSVEPGGVIARRANYIVTDADDYFAASQPGTRPEENGRLALSITDALNFSSTVQSSASSPVGASLDIAAPGNIFIGQPSDDFTGISIDPELFGAIDADSILLGGKREWADTAWRIDTLANEITIDNAELRVNELLISATDNITLQNNSRILAESNSGSSSQFTGNTWLVEDNGVKLLASAISGSALDVNSVSTSNGQLTIDDTSGVTASGTLGLVYDGLAPLDQLSFTEGSQQTRLQVLADSLVVGDTASGAVISAALLQRAISTSLYADNGLTFNASFDANTIDNLLLQTSNIQVAENSSVNFSATGAIRLIASGDGSDTTLPVPTENSRLTFAAPTLTIESMDGAQADAETRQLLSGSEITNLNASNRLLVSGSTRFATAGDVNVQAPILGAKVAAKVGAGGAASVEESVADSGLTNFTIQSANGISLSGGNASAENSALVSPGATFNFIAEDITVDSHISAQSGSVALRASSGDIVLGNNAKIDLRPYTVEFPDAKGKVEKSAPAGIFSARSMGNIIVDDATAFLFSDASVTNSSAQDPAVNNGLVELMASGDVIFNNLASEGTQWANGDLDLRLQSSSLTELAQQQIFRMNQGGFKGDVDILVTGLDQHFILNSNQTLQADSLRLASLQGLLTVAGEMVTTGADSSLLLHGGNGIAITDTATINAQHDFWVEAPTAAITLDELAQITVGGDLNMVSYVAADLDGIAIDASDIISGATNVYLADAYEAVSVDGAQVTIGGGGGGSNGLSTTLTNLMTSVDAQAAVGLDNIIPEINIRPFLDIYSNSNLTLSGSDINLTALRTQLGEPGILQLRSRDAMELRSGINAATTLLTTNISAGKQILLNDDSWSVRVASGTNTNGSYAFDDVRVSDFTEGSLTLDADSFIRTGTGDINIFSAGDVDLQGTSYIASLGRADYLLNPIATPGNFTGALLREEALLPSWGERFYSELMFIFPDFSGFSRDGGSTSIRVAGDLTGFSDSQTSSRFIQRLAEDNSLNTEFFGNYNGIRTWALAVDQINGGIHAVGGGNVNVDVAGAIDNLGFSTPGLAIGTANLNSQGRKIDEYIDGGNLSVSSRSNITHSSFVNDGASVQVFAAGQLGSDAGNDAILLTGSRTDFILNAGRGISIAAIMNTTSVPMTKSPTARSQYAGMPSTLDSVFFDGYDTTSLQATSATGDIYYAGDVAAVNSFLPTSEFYIPGIINSQLYSVLPGQVEFNALDGDVRFDTSLALFPAPDSSLQWRAARNIFSTDTSDSIILAPDIQSTSLPDLNSILTPEYLLYALRDSIFPVLGDQLAHHSNVSGLGPIDRSAAETNSLVALHGNIGDGSNLGIFLPNEVFAYAGVNITNTTFRIQHTRPGQISQILAGGNIEYPIQFVNGQFNQPGALKMELAGPGDLIVSAGGDLDLGASGGVQTVGNQFNSFLPSAGASVHLFSGYKGEGNFSELVGQGIASNTDIFALNNLGLSSDALAQLSLVEWLPLFAKTLDAASTKVANEKNIQSISVIVGLVSQATGTDYRTSSATSDDTVDVAALNRAINAWANLNADLQLRIAASALKEAALANPGLIVAKGEYLFAEPPLGETGFGSDAERQQAKENYWDAMGGLIALEYLLTPNRVGSFTASATSSLATLADAPVASLITQAATTFDQSNNATQLLIAERVMTEHTRQSSVEGGAAGNALLNFERGYLAQSQFFGDDYTPALIGMREKAALINSGRAENIKELKLGKRNGRSFSSIDDVFAAWGLTVPTDATSETRGNMDFVFSSVRALNGGDITLMAPNGTINVGLTASQLEALEIVKDNSQLGVLAFGRGNVNSVVGNGFNVNQSRAFSLAGGDINLWSAYGDIDAGRGAKTAFSTPAPQFSISNSSGLIVTARPPAISGSGIRTSGSRSASNEQLSDQRRFYEVAEGAGATYLSTALGIVDAGEAGIESAGDLFIAAAEVRGADNINVGGVSVGVATNTAVGSDVAGAGNVANAATEGVQDSVTAAASGGNPQDVSAFITIELLDTGT